MRRLRWVYENPPTPWPFFFGFVAVILAIMGILAYVALSLPQ